MGDEERRRAERKAKSGDSDAARRVEVEQLRHGEGVVAHLRTLVGEWVYVEGVKMNYRGQLVEVLTNGAGGPEGLLLDPGVRTGEWDDEPTPDYEELMTGVRMIPYGTVCEVGLQQSHWAKTTPKPGRRRAAR